MKTISVLLLSLTAGFSLTHAADTPKQRPGAAGAGAGGQGREKMREMMLQKFDANKNGTLDPDEKAAMAKAYQERNGGATKGGAPGAKGGQGKGGGKMHEIILQKFDANKNGVLDPDEKAAAFKAYQERKGNAGGAKAGAGAGAGTGGTNAEGGSKFRRPPETSKEESLAKK